MSKKEDTKGFSNSKNINMYSSKIKKIFIELHNFSYFHAPSEIDNIDNHFIGRKKLITRLAKVLSNSSTKSGSYLVTGHRGSGKSSYVSAAINEISSTNKRPELLKRYLILLLLFYSVSYLVFNVIHPHKEGLFLLAIGAFLGVVLSLYYLHKVSVEREEKDHWFRYSWPQSFMRSFIIQENEIPKYKFIKLVQNLFILLVYLVVLFCFKLWPVYGAWVILFVFTFWTGVFLVKIYDTMEYQYFNNLVILFLILLLLTSFVSYLLTQMTLGPIEEYYWLAFPLPSVVFISLFNFLYLIPSGTVKGLFKRNEKVLSRIVRFLFSLFIRPVKDYINYSKLIYIKINLGHDDLKEVDILRLIARNISVKYKELKRKVRINIIWRLFKFIVVYSIVLILFNKFGINKTISSLLLEKTNYYLYFPQQVSSNKDINYNSDFDSIMHELNVPDLGRGQSFLMGLTRVFDYTIQRAYLKTKRIIYYSLRSVIPLKYIENSKLSMVIPQRIDYLFWLFFLLINFVLYLLIRFNAFKITTHFQIMERLDALDANISSLVVDERKNSMGAVSSLLSFGRSRKYAKETPIADVREIEKQLIEILNDVKRIPKMSIRPEFIIIFDELDKISSRSMDSSEEGSISSSVHFSPDGTRARQNAILKLLSNLKFFLTTAQSKFIFIAGREMFDASLADVSDRNYFIGSIFHDVINVDSFLSDESKENTDITKLTEEYVCRYLVPRFFVEYKRKENKKDDQSVVEFNLKLFNDYLKHYPSFKKQDASVSGLTELEINKIIITLHHFIIYLTHASNGTPKKVAKIFEEFIEHVELDSLNTEEKLVVGYRKRNTVFLSFDYYDQYSLNLTSYIAKPIILNLSNSYIRQGDKLLVSTSFLIDQIYKFHRHAFSWSNIESTPELVDIHKTQELRSFISGIIHFLSNTNLHEIVSGLHDYKFEKKLSHELSFLTRIREEASAALSFSLDESLAIRTYFRKLLEIEIKKYSNRSKDDFVYSISYLQVIIADIHFYDEEFDQSIVGYLEAVQELRLYKEYSVSQVIMLVRVMLKLGLAYEKVKSFDMAYITYGELTEILIKFRDIDIRKFGLTERKDGDCTCLIKIEEYEDNELFHQEVLPLNLDSEEVICCDNSSNSYCNNSNQRIPSFVELLGGDIRPKIQSSLFKISTFEGLKLLYQPLLAKLQILEKSHIDGITDVDIKRTMGEFRFLTKTIMAKEKILVQSDFYNKMGDILFYKNFIKGDEQNCDISKTCKYTNGTFSCRACRFYRDGITKLLSKSGILINSDADISFIVKALSEFINSSKYQRIKFSVFDLKSFGKYLSDLSDSVLSCSKMEIDIYELVMIRAYFIKNQTKITIYNDIKNPFLILTFLSSYFYKLSGSYKEHTFQMTKVLYYIKSKIKLEEKDKRRECMLQFSEIVAKDAIKSIFNSYENIHLYDIAKLRDILHTTKYDLLPPVDLKVTTVNTDIQEVSLLYKEIEFISERNENENEKIIQYMENYNPTHPNSINDSMYNRILRLKFKSIINFNILKSYSSNDFSSKHKQCSRKRNFEFFFDAFDDKSISIIEFTIKDSLFCLNEIIKISNTYGFSMMLNYSFIASIHAKLAFWSKINYDYLLFISALEKRDENNQMLWEDIETMFKDIYLKKEDEGLFKEVYEKQSLKDITRVNNVSIDKHGYMRSLEELLEGDNFHFVGIQYQKKEAIRNYHLAIQSHTGGRAYKTTIEGLFFNNDDYNDRLYHFMTAYERMSLNANVFTEKIKDLQSFVPNSGAFSVKNYNNKRTEKKKL